MPSQITCVSKLLTTGDTQRRPESLHEAIRRVGGVRMDGERFNISRQQCAEEILEGVESYCVIIYGVQMSVKAYEKNGEKFIKTRPNKNQTDNLLSLDPC
jgi:hypothetical protein